MGFVTTGKPLKSDHPFFLLDSSTAPTTAAVTIINTTEGKDADSDCEEDDEEDEIVQEEHGADSHADDWHAVSDEVDEEDNEFFDAHEYSEESKDRDE